MNTLMKIYKWRTNTLQMYKCLSNATTTEHEIDNVITKEKKIINKRENKCSKNVVTDKLQEFYGLRRSDALNLTNKYKDLRTVNDKTLITNFIVCKKFELPDHLILKQPHILAQHNLKEKFLALEKLPFPLEKVYPLLLLSVRSLDGLIYRDSKESDMYPGGRIRFMSDLFNETEEFVCERLVKIRFLQTIDLEKLAKSYNLVLSFGLNRSDINKDLWALNYNIETINQRLSFVKDENIGKIKLWMVRAQADIFQKYIERIKENQQVLGNHSIIEYLSEKLDCTDLEAKYLISKLPALKNKSMKKLEEILDFLFKKGFKPIHVYRVPKILLHSVNTMKVRLKELENENIKIDSLYLLTKSQKQYKQYYDALVRNRKSKNYEDLHLHI